MRRLFPFVLTTRSEGTGGNEIEQVVDLLGAGPNLTAVNNLYTFAKQAKRRLAKAEQAAHSRSESIDSQVPIRGFDKENLNNVRVCKTQATKDSHIFLPLAVSVQREQHIRRGRPNGLVEHIRVERTRYHLEFRAPAESGREQLQLHRAGIREQHRDGCVRTGLPVDVIVGRLFHDVLDLKKLGARVREWGIEPEQYVLFLGRFSPEKNWHLLIEAFGRLDTSVDLVLAGGASSSTGYAQTLLQRAGENVHSLDYVSGDAFDELLTNAMLFVLPSDLEGLSLALLEAMGAGVCVLACDIPENREVVDGAGFLFKPGDVADLEHMLRFLISDSAARTSAARTAKQRIREQYQWNEITRRIEDVYILK